MGDSWTFLTNHAHVLLYIAQHPDARLREIAASVGITERATHRIVSELLEAGYLSKKKVGRRSTYKVYRRGPLRHPLQAGRTAADLIESFSVEPDAA
jgi:predicted transcriptional regulator